MKTLLSIYFKIRIRINTCQIREFILLVSVLELWRLETTEDRCPLHSSFPSNFELGYLFLYFQQKVHHSYQMPLLHKYKKQFYIVSMVIYDLKSNIQNAIYQNMLKRLTTYYGFCEKGHYRIKDVCSQPHRSPAKKEYICQSSMH